MSSTPKNDIAQVVTRALIGCSKSFRSSSNFSYRSTFHASMNDRHAAGLCFVCFKLMAAESLGKTLTKIFSQSYFKTLLKSFCIHLIIMFMYFRIYFVRKPANFLVKFDVLKSTFCLVYSFWILVSRQTVSLLCSVLKLNNKNVNTLTDRKLSGFYMYSFNNNKLEIFSNF